ncbi:MAG: OmpA family protein [Gammaproteobacteria bacterium]|nr:OmpA family protein [Gammaproteobacteria bacterium]
MNVTDTIRRAATPLLAVLLLAGCGERVPQPAEVSTAPAAIERMPLPDADVDGVADPIDACAQTPTGVKVDAEGCALDGDADGVADGSDACPDTPSGASVDATGCRPRLAASRAFTLAVEFASGSAEIVGAAAAALQDVKQLLDEFPETTVVIEGHTDSRGTRAANQALSAARAEAVANALVAQGVAAERASATGFGESRPVQPNDTAQGRAANRRVVAIVVPGS